MSEQNPHTTAIIDVGGGFRAIFGAGVLEIGRASCRERVSLQV